MSEEEKQNDWQATDTQEKEPVNMENTDTADTNQATEPDAAKTEENGKEQPKEKTGFWNKMFNGDKDKDKEKEKTPEERIDELVRKLADSEKLRLLALAEVDNQRKRLVKEREQIRMNVMYDTISPFLQVFDYFTMAVAMSEKTQNLDSLIQGMKMIQQMFDKALDELGVEKINAVGQKFDPNLHDAKEQRPSDTVPAGMVLEQWSMGFKFKDRLMRAAKVIVSSGKPQPKEEETPSEQPKTEEAES